MLTTTTLILVGAVVLGTAVTARAAELSPEESEIRKAIVAFAKGGDQRDVATLERLLDPSFRVVASMPGKSAVSVLTRADYLALLRDGKIGGGERTLTIDSVRISGIVAHAAIRMERADVRFDAVVTLVKNDAAWSLIQDATTMVAKK